MILTLQQWTAAVMMIAIVMRISWVDAKTFRIPDLLNLMVAGLGLLYQLPFGINHTLHAVTAAFVIALLLIFLRQIYFYVTGRVGLGLGDVKFATGAALWFSPWNLPMFFLLASSTALIFFLLCMRVHSNICRMARVPFGPFLGMALILTWGIEVSSPFSLTP